MKTYKTDSSFFGYINAPGNFFFSPTIVRWFNNEPNAQFRLIVDMEAEEESLTFLQLQDLYPGVKTIAPITNPWRRLVVIYEALKKANEDKTNLEAIKVFDFSNFTFESFLKQLDAPIAGYSISMSQCIWIKNANELLLIVRDDFLQEDFKMIQEYFESTKPIEVDFIEYRSYYNEDTKKFVEEQFKEDIELFNFSF